MIHLCKLERRTKKNEQNSTSTVKNIVVLWSSSVLINPALFHCVANRSKRRWNTMRNDTHDVSWHHPVTIHWFFFLSSLHAEINRHDHASDRCVNSWTTHPIVFIDQVEKISSSLHLPYCLSSSRGWFNQFFQLILDGSNVVSHYWIWAYSNTPLMWPRWIRSR